MVDWAEKMKLPSPIEFTRMLIAANPQKLDDFDIWIFHPGMIFNSMEKWWGDFGTREFPHEGIDLCLYRDRSGKMRKLGPETRVPVMHDGIVRAVFKDYLGRAIVVEHPNLPGLYRQFLSVHAHTKPIVNLGPGKQVQRGDIIATIADARHSKAKILPHLHLSLAIPSPDLSYDNFVWNIMRDPSRITLKNPLNHIKTAYQLIDGNLLHA